jgi:hypothetical protein
MATPAHHDNSSGEYERKADPDIHSDFHKQRSDLGVRRRSSATAGDKARQNINAKLANPLAGYSHSALEAKGEAYARKHQIGTEEDITAFKLGAVCAQDPAKYDTVQGMSEFDRDVMKREYANKWTQPKLLYLVIILCSTCAAVQGMGESRILDSVLTLLMIIR